MGSLVDSCMDFAHNQRISHWPTPPHTDYRPTLHPMRKIKVRLVLDAGNINLMSSPWQGQCVASMIQRPVCAAD